MIKIVILYYSRDGSTKRMANQIARGVAAIDNCEPVVRTVANISKDQTPDTNNGDCPLLTKQELRDADALIVGSPTRFGNMAAPLKHFFDSTSDLWLSGAMCDKPAAVFTSSSTMHGGQESTLFTMMLPLIHHGMVMVGIPYTEPALTDTQSGGTPYGASHVEKTPASHKAGNTLDTDEKKLCTALGRRVAKIATALCDGLGTAN